MIASAMNRLDEMSGIGMLELRGETDDAAFRTGVESVLDELPQKVGATHESEGRATLCLSPDRWWVSGAEAQIAQVEPRLRAALAGTAHAIVSLSSGLASLRLTGPDAAWILAKGTSIDLDPSVFPRGSARRTLHAGMATVIHHPRQEAADTLFHLYVQRSYRHYVRNWLLVAGRDCALTAGKEWSY